ncbi:MAG: hypothetical protein R2838_03920 [Caldilineaceae bacterium]
MVTIKKIEQATRRPSQQMAELLAGALAIPEAERALFLRMARHEYVAPSAPHNRPGPRRPTPRRPPLSWNGGAESLRRAGARDGATGHAPDRRATAVAASSSSPVRRGAARRR